MRTVVQTVLTFLALLPCAYADDAVVAPLLARALPDWPGHQVTMVKVSYPPGGASAPHRHEGAHTFVYVLSGALEMGVAGSEFVTLKAGETFYEMPEDVHQISRNASDEFAAEFLVFFVHPQGGELTTPHEH